MKYKNILLTIISIISQFLVSSIYADASLHFKNNNSQNDSIIYIKDGKIRFSDSRGQSSEYSIYDSNINKLVHISPARKSYIEVDPDTMNQQMDAVKQRMNAMMAQMKEQMKNIPPEQRQMMENMMSQKMNGQMPNMPQAPQKEHLKTGKTEVIAGIKCEVIKVQLRNIIKEELCIANEQQFSIKDSEKQTIRQMVLFFKELSQKSAAIMGANSMFDQFDGVPIRTIEFNQRGEVISESTLNSISQSNFNSDLISIPTNYTKQTMY